MRNARPRSRASRYFLYHYVYADDVATAILAALERPTLAHRTYNVGSGEALTMPALLDRARAVLPGLQAQCVPGEDDVPDVQTAFDVGAIGRDLGWHPAYPIDHGLLAYRAAMRAGRSAP